jgi:hydroxyacylglutathione hydrolase
MKLFFHYSVYGFSNTYLMGPEDEGDAILVDPGNMDIKLLNYIEKNDYRIRAVLLTHNHENHVHGLRALKKIYDAEIFSNNSSVYDYPCTIVRDGQILNICGLSVEVFSVPGHSSDSVVYKVDRLIFTGDALSAGLPGSTMSAYGTRLLVTRLREKILSQSEDCVILPGHGPPSTVGSEKLSNMALSSDSIEHKVSQDVWEESGDEGI